jgi:hypothetical protein
LNIEDENMYRDVRLMNKALAAMLSLAALSSANAAIPSWSAAVAVSTSNLNSTYATNPSVAVSAHPLAQSIVVWGEGASAISYAIKRSGTWTTAKTVYTGNATAAETMTALYVVVDQAGNATAVWTSTEQGPMKYCARGLIPYPCPDIISFAKAATLAPGQANGIGYLHCAIDGTGQGAAVWDNAYAVQFAKRMGTWSSPQMLESAPGRGYAGTGPYAAYSPNIASDAAGDLLIIWLEFDVLNNAQSIEAHLIPITGIASHTAWPTSSGSATGPSVAMSTDGALGMIAWNDEGAYNTYSASFTPGGGWGQPLQISTGARQYTAM